MNCLMRLIWRSCFTGYIDEVIGVVFKEFLKQFFMLRGKFDNMKICYL